jgi:hypothetical protein
MPLGVTLRRVGPVSSLAPSPLGKGTGLLPPTRRAPEGLLCTPMPPPTSTRPPSVRPRHARCADAWASSTPPPGTAPRRAPSPRNATATPPGLAVTPPRCRDAWAAGVPRPPSRAAPVGRQALLGGWGRLWWLWRRARGRPTTGHSGRGQPPLLPGRGGGLTGLPLGPRRPARRRRPPGSRGALQPCVLQRLQERRGKRVCRLLSGRGIRPVPGPAARLRLRHTGWGLPPVLPTGVGRPQEVERGSGAAPRRWGRRRCLPWLGRATSPWLTWARARRRRRGPPRPRCRGLPLGWLLPAPPRGCTRRHARRAPRPRGGAGIAAPAPADRFGGLGWPGGRRHPRRERGATPGHCLRHLPGAHRLGTRRRALEWRPSRRPVAPLPPPAAPAPRPTCPHPAVHASRGHGRKALRGRTSGRSSPPSALQAPCRSHARARGRLEHPPPQDASSPRPTSMAGANGGPPRVSGSSGA